MNKAKLKEIKKKYDTAIKPNNKFQFLSQVVGIETLKGKTLIDVVDSKDEIYFIEDNDTIYKMYHNQDCCESVEVEDIVGNLTDLVGSPIIMAEEVSNKNNPRSNSDESYTWTFYKLATTKGYVTIRWYGTSNGYYSESVILETPLIKD